MLLGGNVEGANAEGEALETGLPKAAPQQDGLHFFALREGLDGGDEVAVGLFVFRNESSVEGQHGVGVDPEQLPHGEGYRPCELHDAQMAFGAQDAAHLAQASLQFLEVSDAKSRRDGIEGVVGKRERQAIFFGEGDDVLKMFILHFLLAHTHHALRDVGTDEPVGLQHFCGEDGEVARAGGNVEHLSWPEGLETADGLATPAAVDVPREAVVQAVVGGRDIVEHLLHLTTFLFAISVWRYLLLLIHASWRRLVF